MIQLSEAEKKIILICKGHLQDEYPDNIKERKNYWVNRLKPLFKEIYGWDPDEDNNYNDYLRGLFNKLLSIFNKIEYNQSGDPMHYISEIFYSAFYKTWEHDADLPIERAIQKLCSHIACTQYLQNDDKSPRYDLTLQNKK